MLEILDIRTRFLAKKGRSDIKALRAFHDAITSSGALPTALAARAIGCGNASGIASLSSAPAQDH